MSYTLVPFRPVSVDGVDVERNHLDLAPVRHRGQLDESVQGHLHVGQLIEGPLGQVAEDAAEHGLVTDDQQVLLSLQLHYHRLQSGNNILIHGFEVN